MHNRPSVIIAAPAHKPKFATAGRILRYYRSRPTFPLYARREVTSPGQNERASQGYRRTPHATPGDVIVDTLLRNPESDLDMTSRAGVEFEASCTSPAFQNPMWQGHMQSIRRVPIVSVVVYPFVQREMISKSPGIESSG